MATEDVVLTNAVGPQGPLANGVNSRTGRIGLSGELVVGYAHARYFEAVSRGNCYVACNSAAITFGTALTATGVTFHLSNPIASGYNLVILHCSASIITATTAGTIVYAASGPHGTPPATNTAITVRNASGTTGGGVGAAYSVSTLPVAPTAVRVLGGAGVIAAAAGTFTYLSDDVGGGLMVPQGGQLSIQGITIAGTGIISMLWEEVKIAS